MLTKLPDDDEKYTQDYVQGLVPSCASVFKDHFNGRWRARGKFTHMMEHSGISRSWGQRTHKLCVEILLAAIYEDGAVAGYSCPVHLS